MDETSIEENLKTYKSQLTHINGALLAAGQEQNQDLLKLKDDLQELVALTEESLLKVKKDKLLAMLSGEKPIADEQKNPKESDFDDEFAAFQKCLSEDITKTSGENTLVKEDKNIVEDITSDEQPRKDFKFNLSFSTKNLIDSSSSSGSSTENDSDNEEETSPFEELLGSKCRAPFCHSWGEKTYHDAMIISIDPLQLEEDYQPQVTVLFTHPQHRSMVPCQYYLDNRCSYDEQCRFSHGHKVNLADLKEYEDYDHGCLNLESKCLAKSTDKVWYPAVIVDVLPDQTFKVMFDKDHHVLSVSVEDVLPIVNREDHDEVEDEESGKSFGKDRRPSDEEEDSDELPVYLWRPGSQQTLAGMGAWEQHTRGIASKLMTKMGYIAGEGLGKNSEGRVEPVPIQLIPQGKSLDKIMELKAIAGDRDLFDVMRKKERQQKRVNENAAKKYESGKEKEAKNVFDFINRKLTHQKDGGGHHHSHHKSKHSSHKQQPNINKSTKNISERDLKKKSEKGLNIQLFQTIEEVKSTEKEIVRLKQMLARNEGREPAVAKKLREKIASMESYLQRLRTSENSIQRHKQSRKDSKKLTIF